MSEAIFPPRPLRLRAGYLVSRVVGAALLVAVAVGCVLGGVVIAREGPRAERTVHPMDTDYRQMWLERTLGPRGMLVFGVAMSLVMAGAALWGAWALWRTLGRVRRIARRSDEIEVEVVERERVRVRHAVNEVRLYTVRFTVGGETIEAHHGASTRGDRALFLDEEHRFALALVAPEDPRDPLVVRNDLAPFAFSPSEERALRERVERRRDRAKGLA